MAPQRFISNKKASIFLAGIVAALALVSLTACGGASTPIPAQPAATSTVSQVQPVATQATDVSANSATGLPTPDMSIEDTPTSSAIDTPALADPPQNAPTAVLPADTMPDMPTPTDAQPAASATPAPASTDSGGASAAETNVQVALIEWSIQLSQNEVPAGKVRFTVTNQGRMMHNLTVEDDSGVIGRTITFAPSQDPQTLELDLTPGTYTLICSLPGHAQRGQQTTLVVK